MTTEHRSIGKVADPNYMGDCEACGEAWPCREHLRRRLAEVEQVVRKVAQHPCYDVREWVGEVVPCGSCPSCITRAVLDKGEQTDDD